MAWYLLKCGLDVLISKDGPIVTLTLDGRHMLRTCDWIPIWSPPLLQKTLNVADWSLDHHSVVCTYTALSLLFQVLFICIRGNLEHISLVLCILVCTCESTSASSFSNVCHFLEDFMLRYCCIQKTGPMLFRHHGGSLCTQKRFSSIFCGTYALEVRGAHRQNLKLAWEDAWNHARIKLSVKWLPHRPVRP